MVSYLIRKMWKNKWMMLSLLIGNILLIGIVSSTPLYTQATMQRILKKDLQQYQLVKNVYPSISELSFNFNYVKLDKVVGAYYNTRDNILPDTIDKLSIPALSVVHKLSMEGWYCAPEIPREERPRLRTVSLTSFEGYADHIVLTQGRMPSSQPTDGVIECLANENTLLRQDLLLEERLAVSNVADLGLYIKVVGVYQNKDENDLYWTTNPNSYANTLLVSDELISNHFIDDYISEYRLNASWIIMLDYEKISAPNVPYYLLTDQAFKARFNTNDHIWNYKENFISTIKNYTLRTDKLTVTLWVLQLPIYVLLAFYIFMVSKQILMLEQNDISVLKSRGASRGQIFGLYTMQSVFTAVVSILAGLPLGAYICRMLGASSGFLNLVQRAALQVEFNADAFLYSGIAAVFSMITMLTPVIRFSRVGIVDYKRSKSGRPKKSLWQRSYLDVLCFGIACYGLYSFNNRRDLMAVALTDVQSVDPLLYASASLFIIGLGLLCLRVFPYLVKLVFWIGKRFWSPALYASLLKVIRSAGEEQFIMIFLVFTLAVGIFDAKAARTINLNNDQKIAYLTGADLVFSEKWQDNLPPVTSLDYGGAVAQAMNGDKPVVYAEPDFGRFTGFEEADAVTKVFTHAKGQVRTSGSTVNEVNIMGIETDSFGEVLWYRDDLLPVHVNYFLNTLARRTDGVLLSDNFRTKLGYKIGDPIYFGRYEKGQDSIQGVVCGFVPYWPGYAAVNTTVAKTGETLQTDNYLVVANISYLYTAWSVQPYSIWMKTNTPANRFIYDYVEANDIKLSSFHDTKGEIIESKSDPILQGTNGILTVGFIVTLLVCFTGFLIYWILSIKSRVLQFGIFRAMGMSMRNILSLLINEQLFITLTSVLIGAGVGEISSRLFVPLIQISYTASEQVIPLMVVTEPRDYANLYVTVGIMIAVCLTILGVLISKIKIAQALKLGED